MTAPAHPTHGGPFAPGVADEAVLRLLATYGYLTAEQICRALYSLGSLTRVQMIAKRLRDGGFVQAIFLPRRTQAGSAPSVYTPTRRGRLFLQGLGVPVSVRVRPSEIRATSYLFLAHTLAVNDVLLAAAQLTVDDPRVSLVTVMQERVLKRMAVTVPDARGKQVRVIPDAWLDFRFQDDQVCLCLELDRGTEERKAWKRKVHNLIAYANGPYQTAFGTTSLTIAVLTTSGEKRCQDLRRWTEEELVATDRVDLKQCFLFASLTPGAVSPRHLFLERIWHVPFTEGLCSVIESEGDG